MRIFVLSFKRGTMHNSLPQLIMETEEQRLRITATPEKSQKKLVFHKIFRVPWGT